jgi:tetratricopeptide (TPR) repeat protein
VVDDDVRVAASGAVSRGERPASSAAPDRTFEAEVRRELAKAVPKAKVARSEARLADAARAFRRDRFADAAKILRPLADEAPTAASVRELYGLALYRQGRWGPAAKELEAFRVLSGSTEQHPVLADCYRALHRWSAVDELWEELRSASPSAALVTEGRIVTAGALADEGRLPAAIGLLEQGWRRPKRPVEHHLRRAYALADLYERAGEVVRARDLFAWVASHDDAATDADRRARSLG